MDAKLLNTLLAFIRRIPAAVVALRSVEPIGAGLIFLAGMLAAYIGPLAGLSAVAFLVGLHLAKPAAAAMPSKPAAVIEPTAAAVVNGSKPAAADGKLAAALDAGLVVRGITLGAPPAAKIKQAKGGA